MSQIVNRIDHVVWMCRPENHQAYVDKLSDLLEIEFEVDDGGEDFGLRFTWSFSAGLEVVSPSGDGHFAEMCWKYLEKKGEGLFSVVVGVADVTKSRERAVALGCEPGPYLKLHEDLRKARELARAKGKHVPAEKPWLKRVQDCTECVLDADFIGGHLAVGRIVTDEPGGKVL